MILTIHAVPFNSDTLTAECGQRLGVGGHTGHFRPLRAISPDTRLCDTCADSSEKAHAATGAQDAPIGGVA